MKAAAIILSAACLSLVVILIALLNQNARLKAQLQVQKTPVVGQFIQKVGEFRIVPAMTNTDGTPLGIHGTFQNCVEGIVTNVSGKKLEVAVIGFTLRDKTGNVVDYFETSLQNLNANETWKFRTRPFDSQLNPICSKFEGTIEVRN